VLGPISHLKEMQMEIQQKDQLKPMVEALESILEDTEKVGRHAYYIIRSLSHTCCWDTLTVTMQALGHDERDILKTIKAWHMRHGMSVSSFWEAITRANIELDSDSVVIAALSEVHEAHKRPNMHQDVPL
jgi:hypothetical protein